MVVQNVGPVNQDRRTGSDAHETTLQFVWVGLKMELDIDIEIVLGTNVCSVIILPTGIAQHSDPR